MKEYKVVSVDLPTVKMNAGKRITEIEETLNSFAAQGWELVYPMNLGQVGALILSKQK